MVLFVAFVQELEESVSQLRKLNLTTDCQQRVYLVGYLR